MPQNYSPEFKKKLVRLHEAEGRTYKSIIAELAELPFWKSVLTAC